MKKIPSLFKRDYQGTRLVYDEVVPGCEWVLAGEGRPTEKIDGTACAILDGALFVRYDRKRGKAAPPGWLACEDAPDPESGHWPGWVPVGDGPEHKHAREAFELWKLVDNTLTDGTYELVGPKVQSNPYGLSRHELFPHGTMTVDECERTFTGIATLLRDGIAIEGIVWHHPDGRMCKIKRKDFGLPWPVVRTEEVPDAHQD